MPYVFDLLFFHQFHIWLVLLLRKNKSNFSSELRLHVQLNSYLFWHIVVLLNWGKNTLWKWILLTCITWVTMHLFCLVFFWKLRFVLSWVMSVIGGNRQALSVVKISEESACHLQFSTSRGQKTVTYNLGTELLKLKTIFQKGRTFIFKANPPYLLSLWSIYISQWCYILTGYQWGMDGYQCFILDSHEDSHSRVSHSFSQSVLDTDIYSALSCR